jgi:hypothetical protein
MTEVISFEDAIKASGSLRRSILLGNDPAKCLAEAREQLARYAERRKDIDWIYVDAATANVWGTGDSKT